MLLSTRCSRTSGTCNPLHSFLCNRGVDLLKRFRALGKRIRIRSRCYNNRYYGGKPEVTEVVNASTKLQEDALDYRTVAKELVKELLSKIPFLSNSDCIQIADILSRIKKPLHRIGSNDVDNKVIKSTISFATHHPCGLDRSIAQRNVPSTRPDRSELVATLHQSIAQDSVIRLIVKGQKTIYNVLLEAYHSKVLTKAERYYLYCLLSKECSLVPLDTWLTLVDELKTDMEVTTSFLAFEHSNLLLIYDQVCRWIAKRKVKDKAVHRNEVSSDPIAPQRCLVAESCDRYQYQDPFDNAFLDDILQKLNPLLDQLNSKKILKLLYLQHSRYFYNRTFFASAFEHLVATFAANRDMEAYRAAVSIYHRVTMSNLCKELQLIGIDHKILESTSRSLMLSTGEDLINRDNYLSTEQQQQVKVLNLRSINELIVTLSTCFLGLIVLYLRATKGPDSRIDAIEHKILELMENNCHEENLVPGLLLQRMSSDLASYNSTITFKSDFEAAQRVVLLKTLLSHLYFNFELTNHVPRREQYQHIHDRSNVFTDCYIVLLENLADILLQNGNEPSYLTHVTDLESRISFLKDKWTCPTQNGDKRRSDTLRSMIHRLETIVIGQERSR